jgi:hypothetical protein
MKIHSDKLTRGDFLDAARRAQVELIDFEECGSRSRAKGFKFSLTGSSPHRRNFSTGNEPAATWDEWGIFLACLFAVDCESYCGSKSYRSEEHFHWCTGNRFRSLTTANQHKRHKWEPLGSVPNGTYAVARCEVCGAVQRWELNGQHVVI